MVFKDYYKVLGLNSNKVSEEDIKLAYRDKAKQFHPDINVGNNAAEEIFKEINEAYRILSNEKTRRRYDFSWIRYARHQRNKEATSQSRTIKDMALDILFGSNDEDDGEVKMVNSSKPHNGEDVHTSINISLKEGFFGVKKEIVLKNIEGEDSKVSVKIPAGIQNGDKIRVVGGGKKGSGGGKDGNLYIVINIENDINYELRGIDLYIKIKLKPYEAVLGTKKNINVFDEDINLVIPETTKCGSEFILEGKGYKAERNNRGNLHLIVDIDLPDKLDPKTKKLYEELKKLDK